MAAKQGRTVRITSVSDGVNMDVPVGLALKSRRLAAMMRVSLGDLSDSDTDSDMEEGEELHLYNEKGSCLAVAVAFLEHHDTVPYETVAKPVAHNKFADLVASEFDRNLMARVIDQEVLDVVRTAEFLQLDDLLDLAVVKLATIIGGAQTAEDLDAALGLKGAPSPDAVDRVLAEYPCLDAVAVH